MPEQTVFVCTTEECEAGPWEGSHDAMAHCAENRGHAYTGRPAAAVESDPLPATSTEARDNRNLQHKGDPHGATDD